MRKLLTLLAVVFGLSLAATGTSNAQGILRVALGTTLSQIDPAKTTIGDEYVYVHLVFNGLSRIDPDMTVKPDLAESWTASDDLKIWTFDVLETGRFVLRATGEPLCRKEAPPCSLATLEYNFTIDAH